jgi:uncharacterized membrane protein
VALVFACLAFTPSLLPRGAPFQGIVCGITAAIGYGVGVVGAWAWRAFADRDPRPPRKGSWGSSRPRPWPRWRWPSSWARDEQARAELAVDDLERAGGFDRAHLLVATTT